MGTARPYFDLDGYNFVAYPDRNSAFVKALIDLGWLDTRPKAWLITGITWVEAMQKAIGAGGTQRDCFGIVCGRALPIPGCWPSVKAF